MFSVIIPSRNIDNLVPCVEAVRRCEMQARIIVVDDGLDWTAAEDLMWLEDQVVPGQVPFIFSRNVNAGIRAALSDAMWFHHRKDCPCGNCNSGESPVVATKWWTDDGVVILGDDGLLQTPSGFSLLVSEAEAHPEFGIISSTVNNVGNLNQLPKGIGLREEPRTVCFVCVYIPRRTIETVGLMDEEFIGYGMDDDSYCLRVRRAGLKLGIHDSVFVDHSKLTSTFRGAPGAGGDFRPNLKIFIEKYGVDNWGQPKETSQFRELFP